MRALARGLTVLDFIARSDGVTFTQIVQSTGLSKAVITRILNELSRSGFVFRRHSDRCYFGAPLITATPGGSYAHMLLSASSAPIQWLVKQVGWPSDLFMVDGHEMIMIDSSRPESPYQLRWSRIGRRAPILLSSVGRAVLSRMGENERDVIYASLKERGEWAWQTGRLRQPLATILQETAQRRYSIREQGFAGPALERSGETSIGVALVASGVVIGGLNIWWPEKADQARAFHANLAGPLNACREMIERNLSQIDSPADSETDPEHSTA